MASFNQVIIIGNLTRDPEVRYTPSGSAVAEISLAVNRKYKGNGGEMKEETTYIDCTAWGKTAELVGQYVKKGEALFIQGRLTTDSWEDKQTGQKRSKTKVTAEAVQFMGGKREGGGGQSQQQTRPAGGYRKANVPPADNGGGADGWDDEEKIPF